MALRRLILSCVAVAAAACCRRAAAATVSPVPSPTPTPAAPVHRRFEASVGYHFSSGHYGASETTEIHYVPLVVEAEISRWLLRATIAYLRVDGPPGIIDGPAGPIATDGSGDGFGDVFARASYLLPRKYTWPSWVPFVEVAGLVKFPTASRSDGLGTGEFDFGIESEITWAFGRLTPFAVVGYRFLGDPPNVDLNDVFGSTVGASYRFVDAVSAGLLLDYRQASSSSTGERLEIVPFTSWKFLAPWSLDLYASAGLADGSPDAGTGVQLGYTW